MFGRFVWKVLLKQVVGMIKDSVMFLLWNITDGALSSLVAIAESNPCKILSIGGPVSFPGHRKRRFVIIFTMNKVAPEGWSRSRHIHRETVEVDGEDVDIHVWLNTAGRKKYKRLKKQGRVIKLSNLL